MDTINDTITCSQKEMMIIPKGISHSEKVDPGKSAFKNIVIAFEKETISIHSAIEKNNSSPSVNELQQYDSEYVPDIIRYLDKVTSWYNPSFSLHNEAALNLLLTVLNLILDKIEDPVRPRQKESHKVTQCRKLIFEHLVDQQLSVIWLAKIIKCAPDYLSYIFHRETKSKLAVYINDKRIDFAKELLSESNLNIAEISQICGYRDPGYMTRQFKKRCGESPRRYRNNMN